MGPELGILGDQLGNFACIATCNRFLPGGKCSIDFRSTCHIRFVGLTRPGSAAAPAAATGKNCGTLAKIDIEYIAQESRRLRRWVRRTHILGQKASAALKRAWTTIAGRRLALRRLNSPATSPSTIAPVATTAPHP